MRRILVTGAAGFVGRHLLPILAAGLPDAEILASDFDLTDPDAVIVGVRAARPDGCVHLAAISAIPAARADPEAAWAVNLRGTLNLARAILAEAPRCVMVFASTADAYGASFRAGLPLDETAPLAPMNAYGATKAAADLALGAMAASDGLRLVRARPFNHTGPGQTAEFAIPAFARQIARIAAGFQPPVLRVGALDAKRDFLDVRDVCDAYLRCLTQADDLPAGAIVNIASGVPRRIGDVLDDLLRLAGVAAEIETDPARLRPADIPSAVGDPGLARKLLGWTPHVHWQTTLRDVIEDWRARVAAEGE
jgi:nucleoside-diphosphate-sugar epimerase